MFKKIIACLLLAAALFTLLPACGEKEPEVTVKDVPIRAVSQKVLEAFGDEFTGDTEIDAAYLADTYGVKAEWVEDFIGLMPMISFDVDLFIAVKAKDGQADAVEAALKDYYEFITADAAKYPLNFAKIRATEVYRLGDYVFFLQMGVIPEDVKQNNEEEAYNIAVANNKKAIDAINAVLIEEAK